MLITSLASTRSLLHVHGAEAAKFLQGLVTNDIIKQGQQSQSDNGSSHAVYAGFLSAQGRVLHDTFILPSTSSSSSSTSSDFLIDYPNNVTSPSLPSYIKRYILRSKVKSKSADDQYRLWAVFNDPLQIGNINEEGDVSDINQAEEEIRSLAGENGGKWWRDHRSKAMGYRLLLSPEASKAIESSSFASSLPSFHSLLRIMTNVPEAPTDLVPNSALPLESNMDIMGGIDFRKGCYIGQELTARTYHTGVIRKRMMPVRLYSAGSSPPTSLLPESWTKINSATPLSLPEETEIRPSASSSSTSTRRPRAAGKLSSILRVTGSSSSSGKEEEIHVGLALLRLESADGELGMSCLDSTTAVAGIAEGTEQITATGHAGVNNSGGLQDPDSSHRQGGRLQGEWMVKAFRESLEGAK